MILYKLFELDYHAKYYTWSSIVKEDRYQCYILDFNSSLQNVVYSVRDVV